MCSPPLRDHGQVYVKVSRQEVKIRNSNYKARQFLSSFSHYLSFISFFWLIPLAIKSGLILD